MRDSADGTPVDVTCAHAAADDAPFPVAAAMAAPAPALQAGRVQVFPDGMRDWLVGVIALVAAIHLLAWAEPILVPLVVGVLGAAVLEPGVEHLARWRVPRVLAAAVMVIAMAVLTGVAAYHVTTEAAQVVQALPETTKRLRQLATSYVKGESAVAQLRKAAAEIDKATATTRDTTPGVTRVEVVERPLDVGNLLWSGWMGAVDVGGRLVYAFFLAFFLLSSEALFRRKILRLIGGAPSSRRVTVQMLDRMRDSVSHFLVHLAVTSTAVGVLSWLAYRWLGVEQAAFWGMAAGLLNVVPYVGAMAASFGAGMAMLTQTGSLEQALLVTGVAVTITSLEGFVLSPLLLRHAAALNPVAIIVGLAFWTWLWGIWGMLLGVPIIMLMKIIADHVAELRSLGDWLGTD